MTKKVRRKSPWPKGLRIHPENNPLADLPDTHPAKRVIISHAECCRDCVGHEIAWPGRGDESFDQRWDSVLLQRAFSFSSYGYAFLSYDLILEEWLSHPAQVTETEMRTLSGIPILNALLDECEQAATEHRNERVLQRLPQMRRHNELMLEAVHRRLAEDGLSIPPRQSSVNPITILGLQYPPAASCRPPQHLP